MPAPVIAAGIGGISSIIGGGLAGRSKTQTSTSTMTPTWSPEMQDLQKQLSGYSSGLMTDPMAGIAPIKAAASENINRRYAAMPGQISRAMASRGYGSSGNFGNTMYAADFARSGEMSDLDSQIAQMILAQKNQGASLAEQLLSMTRGTTTTGTGTSPSTAAGDVFQSGGNAMSNLATLLMLQNVLKGRGTPSPGSGPSENLPTMIGG